MSKVQQPTDNLSKLPQWLMLLLAIGIGIIAGYGAIFFRLLIGCIHNFFFFLKVDPYYNTILHAAPSYLGAGIILVPMVGGILVTWLTTNFAPEAKGHGVPEVMESIFFRGGKIRPIVAVVKSIASAITIGTGGSVGREGPIIQIGAAFGSMLSHIIAMPARQRIVLLAAGAGAGIAATFNAPIGGMAFAVELLLVSISSNTLSVVAIATVTATFISRYYLGVDPAFTIPSLLSIHHSSHIINLFSFIPLGILLGLSAMAFIKSLYWTEDYFDKRFTNPYCRSLIATGILGILIYTFMHFTGHYYIQGIGYATISDILNGHLPSLLFLTLLCLSKLIATNITLAGGGSGGVFSPSLFLGATISVVFGSLINLILPPEYSLNPGIYAVAGMAAMVASTTGAVLTAITMIFEMTREYNAMLPIIISIALAYSTRRYVCKEGIYTLKLLRRGKRVHEGLQAALHSSRIAKDMMSTNFQLLDNNTISCHLLHDIDTIDLDQPQIIHQNDAIIGLLDIHHLTRDTSTTIEEHDYLINRNFTIISPYVNIFDVLRRMQKPTAQTLLISTQPHNPTTGNIVGVITPHQISQILIKSSELFG